MLIKSLVAVFLAAILTENYVLSKFLGICPFLGVSKKLNTKAGKTVKTSPCEGCPMAANCSSNECKVKEVSADVD